MLSPVRFGYFGDFLCEERKHLLLKYFFLFHHNTVHMSLFYLVTIQDSLDNLIVIIYKSCSFTLKPLLFTSRQSDIIQQFQIHIVISLIHMRKCTIFINFFLFNPKSYSESSACQIFLNATSQNHKNLLTFS